MAAAAAAPCRLGVSRSEDVRVPLPSGMGDSGRPRPPRPVPVGAAWAADPATICPQRDPRPRPPRPNEGRKGGGYVGLAFNRPRDAPTQEPPPETRPHYDGRQCPLACPAPHSSPRWKRSANRAPSLLVPCLVPPTAWATLVCVRGNPTSPAVPPSPQSLMERRFPEDENISA